MKVFLTGATGVIGHRAVAQLVAAGHEVGAVARTSAKADLVRALGARPLEIDVFDREAVRASATGADAIVNLATKIPPLSKAALPGAWAENDRIRRQLSALLVEVAGTEGVGRFVQESIAFIYEDGGDRWLDEDAPIDPTGNAAAAVEAERNAAAFAAAGGAAVVLRFAQFYAHDSTHTQAFIRAVRRRVAPVIGPPDGYMSSIHADDAAAAVVAALEAPAGTYNVGDDEPLSRRHFAGALAAALGVKPPHFLPTAAAKLAGSKVAMLTRSHRVANARLRDSTSWTPSYSSARDGWPAVLRDVTRSEQADA